MPSVEDQLVWFSESVNSTDLYRYLAKNSNNFKLIFFAPYLFGTTFWGSLINTEKACLIPCLHDENYAYTDVVGSMFRQVGKAFFNSLPEMELAKSLYGDLHCSVVGMGFNLEDYDNTGYSHPYFEEQFPYILYIGRKETGKNVQLLIDYFITAKENAKIENNVKLIIAGGGDFSDLGRDEAILRKDVIDLKQVTEEEKFRLIKNALFLCQPSTNESFSIVLMEAWALSTPVVVAADCSVTRHHVTESGGGLYFRGAREFALIVNKMAGNHNLCQKLAKAGKRYVAEEYCWEAVTSRFDQAVQKICT